MTTRNPGSDKAWRTPTVTTPHAKGGVSLRLDCGHIVRRVKAVWIVRCPRCEHGTPPVVGTRQWALMHLDTGRAVRHVDRRGSIWTMRPGGRRIRVLRNGIPESHEDRWSCLRRMTPTGWQLVKPSELERAKLCAVARVGTALVEPQTAAWAARQMLAGKRVERKAWAGDGYGAAKALKDGTIVRAWGAADHCWTATAADLIAADWMVVE